MKDAFRYNGVMKKIRSVLNKTELAGGVLFPLFTLFLILRDDPLTTNLSWVGNGLDYRLLLVIWAIVGALVFRAMIRALAEALGVSLQRREDLTFLLPDFCSERASMARKCSLFAFLRFCDESPVFG